MEFLPGMKRGMYTNIDGLNIQEISWKQLVISLIMKRYL